MGSTGKIIKWGCIALAVLLAAALLMIGASRGKNVGAAAPSSGGGQYVKVRKLADIEPLADEQPALPEADTERTDLSALAAENEAGESVFAISASNLIDCFNAVYRQAHDADYLNSTNSDNWYLISERSPCFGYAAVRYKFSEDKTVWPMPTISLYAPVDDTVYEVRMTFDDHGYQDGLYALFRELCICMEKAMMPELSETEAETLFETLYAQSDDNFFGTHAAFGDPERPQLNAVYFCGNIGMYGFYGAGNREICFIPLTPSSRDRLQEDGVPLSEWKETD